MGNKKFGFYEKARVVIAQELDMPPDDIDILSIMSCCERAIRCSCEESNEEYLIDFKNKDEEEAVLCEAGQCVVAKVFGRQSPFYDWADEYEDECIDIQSDDWE